ncbi:MAG: CrcB family protein [Actinobacteria bacterium]|nr:CrcB family protein [Actinomycetota bacterium]
MTALVAIVAGSIGAAGRYWAAGLAQAAGRGHFPTGTMAVNLAGSLAAGVALGATEPGTAVNAALVGLLAGFTTFSTWSAETLAMARSGEWLRAALNLAGMPAAGIALAALGYALAH